MKTQRRFTDEEVENFLISEKTRITNGTQLKLQNVRELRNNTYTYSLMTMREFDFVQGMLEKIIN